MNRYYNTTHETGQVLIQFSEKAKRLEDTVFQIFQREGRPLNWSEVFTIIPDQCEGSIKRSLTNLKTEGKLIKTSEKTLSKYNKPAYRYRIAG